jgi:hypothetical protein
MASSASQVASAAVSTSGIVGGGDAVAGLVGPVVGTVVDQHAAPGHMAPVDVALDE